MKNEYTLNKNRACSIIPIESIPTIELYVDQVTTFMEKRLSAYKRYDDDKILTKTMINNYAKARLFPSPVKKKYSKSHIILLILIYHLKSTLSISDISKLFNPINELLDKDIDCPKLDKLYVIFTEMQKSVAENKEYPLNPDDYSQKEYNFLSVLNCALVANRTTQIAESIIDIEF